MSGLGKYIWAALAIAALTHFAVLYALPRVLMNVAIESVGQHHFNAWRLMARATEKSRTVVRPSPDFAYSACPYDLTQGPMQIRAAPWEAYWSLSLYADNSDNFFVVDDREAKDGADLTLIRQGAAPPERATRVVESPNTRGMALIRRLAPRADDYSRAAEAARGDICATIVRPAN